MPAEFLLQRCDYNIFTFKVTCVNHVYAKLVGGVDFMVLDLACHKDVRSLCGSGKYFRAACTGGYRDCFYGGSYSGVAKPCAAKRFSDRFGEGVYVSFRFKIADIPH